MIFPSAGVLNKLEGAFFIWIRGENRSGKTALALDIAEYYLKDNFRLISNLDCVWNDPLPLELDSNAQLNAIVILDEGGTFMRSKESIRHVMGFKGKLNAMFLMPSSEEPHEDLWRNYIEPAELLNGFLETFFGSWFVSHILKIWRLVRFDAKRGTKESLFLQVFPHSVWYLYSTLLSGYDAEGILSQFEKSFTDQQVYLGNANLLRLQDVVTKKSGAAESHSFYEQQVFTQKDDNRRGIFTSKKKR
jgi:hypothetical protein